MSLGAVLGIPSPPDWTRDAACVGYDPRLWDEGRPAARFICDTCPVRAQCAEAGRAEEAGMWGGLRESEREVNQPTGKRKVCQSCGEQFTADIAQRRKCEPCRAEGRREAHQRYNRNRDRRNWVA